MIDAMVVAALGGVELLFAPCLISFTNGLASRASAVLNLQLSRALALACPAEC